MHTPGPRTDNALMMSWVSVGRSFSVAPDQAFFRPATLALVAGGDWEGAVKVIEVTFRRENKKLEMMRRKLLVLLHFEVYVERRSIAFVGRESVGAKFCFYGGPSY